jgi:molybdopterin/thiamine biosynthesis adenylyltransferase
MKANTIKRQIQEHSKSYIDPGGKRHPTISLTDVRLIAAENCILPREVEISCLKHGVIPRRYLRNLGTIDIEGQLKLLRSTAAVAGAGGLGGTIIELLARCGIGHLIIIDNGRFVENNLNRQVLATEEYLGKYKVKLAATRVKAINSAVTVTTYNRAITAQNVARMIKGADVVLDGLDNLPTRLAVADACTKLGIPFVHGAIAGFSGQVMTIMPGDKGLNALYGTASESNTYGIEAVTGNPPATPAIIAAWEVQEAVKLITGIGKNIRNRLLLLDFAESTFEELPLE